MGGWLEVIKSHKNLINWIVFCIEGLVLYETKQKTILGDKKLKGTDIYRMGIPLR
jgi:hypothetical protein